MTENGVMSERFEFGSSQWFDLAHRTLESLRPKVLKELDGREFSVCEVYENVPRHLAPDQDGRIAWHFRFRQGALEFGKHEVDDVDFKLVIDYATVVPLAKVHYENDPGASKLIQQLSRNAIAAGKMTVKGTTTHAPASLARLHDALAERTL